MSFLNENEYHQGIKPTVFRSIPQYTAKEANIIMDVAAGLGDDEIDLPRHADSQMPKRLAVAAMLSADTLKAAGQWDTEAEHLDISTPGGKRMERALSRLINDYQHDEVKEGGDVRWLARRIITDIEAQSFASCVIKAASRINDADQVDSLKEENHAIYMIADRLAHYPEEYRTMEMQAMGWYENMPQADREDIAIDFTRMRLDPHQDLYLETIAEPYAKPNGLPEMTHDHLTEVVGFPKHETLVYAQRMIEYHWGTDRTSETKREMTGDPFLNIVDVVLNTVNIKDFGHSLNQEKGYPREVIALGRAIDAVDRVHEFGKAMTNHDVTAMMFADIKLMADTDRSNLEALRNTGENPDAAKAKIAGGNYEEIISNSLFFPTALTDKSVHVGVRDQKNLLNRLIDCKIEPTHRFAFERSNDPLQTDKQRKMILGPSPFGDHSLER